ncbi:gamma-butyrobetaine dioxygenase [Modicisalibacter ilicicola DSM 19980]|uniref:Gamma-butyrobetaine dioxygenase n=1 Tax=Modicisalibacter ilicicola DSM 19980 TaxID=1121942 RepID=A0A1M4TD47_9GAMM|nr:TauD/TfdA family dioxygenase [Halomonas ilicicola]SHE42401.1 gamma-butyrobetaine dioxygenase [Halomonas ilicicola DSM 19980]
MNTPVTEPSTNQPSLDMGELSPHAEGPRLIAATSSGDHLALHWVDGSQAHFPLLWLRDHCSCSECRHPLTRERLFVPLEDIDEAPRSTLVEGGLRLQWADGHVSLYDAVWLHQRRPGDDADPNGTLTRLQRPWPEAFAPEHVKYSDFMTTDGERHWLEVLLRDGLVVLDDGPLIDEEVSRIAGRIGPMRATNFGARFDVYSKPNPNNAAYTAIGLALHSDLPNWRQPPDIQLLYCLQNEAEGGESLFADGFAVAERLRVEAPEAFRVLSETPIDFRFQDEEQDIAARAPVIALDDRGRLKEIRFNNWIRDTLRLPLDTIDAWYRAYRQFWLLLHDPRHQIEFALEPGQMVAFDNRRVLHGRRAFDPSTGRRHLQGTYLDIDMIESRLRVLQRRT